MKRKITRRKILKSTMTMVGLGYLGLDRAFSTNHANRFKIGACDWSINQMAKVEAIEVAKKIGLDGIQVSLGTVDNDMHLRQVKVQQKYLEACKNHGVSLGSIAIGELNRIPYKSDRRAETWVADSIEVATALECKVVLLAFFGKGDLKDDEAGMQETIRRLKKVAPKAEDHQIILGIESWLSAKEHMDIINEVGSPNVKVYYDVANSNKMGYDIYEEIRWLGGENICEFHAKENGHLLGQGKIDFQKVRSAMDDIGYRGWVHIEGAVPENADVFDSYVANNKFIRSVLQN